MRQHEEQQPEQQQPPQQQLQQQQPSPQSVGPATGGTFPRSTAKKAQCESAKQLLSSPSSSSSTSSSPPSSSAHCSSSSSSTSAAPGYRKLANGITKKTLVAPETSDKVATPSSSSSSSPLSSSLDWCLSCLPKSAAAAAAAKKKRLLLLAKKSAERQSDHPLPPKQVVNPLPPASSDAPPAVAIRHSPSSQEVWLPRPSHASRVSTLPHPGGRRQRRHSSTPLSHSLTGAVATLPRPCFSRSCDDLLASRGLSKSLRHPVPSSRQQVAAAAAAATTTKTVKFVLPASDTVKLANTSKASSAAPAVASYCPYCFFHDDANFTICYPYYNFCYHPNFSSTSSFLSAYYNYQQFQPARLAFSLTKIETSAQGAGTLLDAPWRARPATFCSLWSTPLSSLPSCSKDRLWLFDIACYFPTLSSLLPNVRISELIFLTLS